MVQVTFLHSLLTFSRLQVSDSFVGTILWPFLLVQNTGHFYGFKGIDQLDAILKFISNRTKQNDPRTKLDYHVSFMRLLKGWVYLFTGYIDVVKK